MSHLTEDLRHTTEKEELSEGRIIIEVNIADKSVEVSLSAPFLRGWNVDKILSCKAVLFFVTHCET